MKKLIMIVIIIFFMIFIVACGDNGNSETETPQDRSDTIVDDSALDDTNVDDSAVNEQVETASPAVESTENDYSAPTVVDVPKNDMIETKVDEQVETASSKVESTEYDNSTPAVVQIQEKTDSPVVESTEPDNQKVVEAEEGGAEIKVNVGIKDFIFELEQDSFRLGDTIIFVLEGIEGRHGFAITGTGINEPISTGETKMISWTPEQAGTYTIRCSIMCGSGHSTMNTTLSVN